jgi:hypothetical protein
MYLPSAEIAGAAGVAGAKGAVASRAAVVVGEKLTVAAARSAVVAGVAVNHALPAPSKVTAVHAAEDDRHHVAQHDHQKDLARDQPNAISAAADRLKVPAQPGAVGWKPDEPLAKAGRPNPQAALERGSTGDRIMKLGDLRTSRFKSFWDDAVVIRAQRRGVPN